MKIEDFIQDYLSDIRNDSIAAGTTPSNQFLESMINQLESLEYIFSPTIMPFYKNGTNNKVMRFDAVAIDEVEKSLSIITNDYIDDFETPNLNQSDINQIVTRMLNFVEEVKKGTYKKYIDESQDTYKFAEMIEKRINQGYINSDFDNSINKINLFILTNKKLSSRVSNIKLEEFEGLPIELNVWDIQRIFDIYSMGREKEPISIDVKKYNNGKGIECIKAHFSKNTDYDSYLCVIPGKLLSDIYWEYGSRLLEGNVRAYLSNRGSVNKGIKKTIMQEPDKFFTYNNGIACTAKKVELNDDLNQIIAIEDLQIINGGQTTASLTSAWKNENTQLENIYVPMKITIIYSDEYEDMVANISKYANSQNKVTASDFFSNHAFHRAMESYSKSLPAPPKKGEYHSTYWYYERSRGKFFQEQFKLQKKSDIDAFLRKYPKNQVITKEDLAKYVMAGEFMRPDCVSLGKQKNMEVFGKIIAEEWEKSSTRFNQYYYQKAICYSIIFNTIDHVVKNASWYNVGGIKLNIIPYTFAKIMASLPQNYSLDFDKIWKNQSLSESFIHQIDIVAQMANEFIHDSGNIIVTEYAKKEETWKKFKAFPLELSKDFFEDLTNSILINEKDIAAQKEAKESEVINIDVMVVELASSENGNYWNRLLQEGTKRRLLNGKEVDILKNYIIPLSSPNPKRFPSSQQCKIAWLVRKRIGDDGVTI